MNFIPSSLGDPVNTSFIDQYTIATFCSTVLSIIIIVIMFIFEEPPEPQTTTSVDEGTNQQGTIGQHEHYDDDMEDNTHKLNVFDVFNMETVSKTSTKVREKYNLHRKTSMFFMCPLFGCKQLYLYRISFSW